MAVDSSRIERLPRTLVLLGDFLPHGRTLRLDSPPSFGSEAFDERSFLRGKLTMMQRFRKLAKEEDGQDLIEYALIAALIGLSGAAILRGLSNKVGNTVGAVGNALTNAV